MSDGSRSSASPLVELFAKASGLSGVEQEAFVRRIRRERAELGADLERLISTVAAKHAPLSERVSRQYSDEADPQISLEPGGESESPDFASEIVQRLVDRGASYGRYKLREEIARGGQGAVLRVWDEDLRRSLAMKVVLDAGEISGNTPDVDSRSLGRFLEEAQVTAQLDHPGIVPVHELGLDSEGRAYFTMKLVKGRDLRAIFALVQAGKEGWTQTRALGVLLKVCEAMSYAHAKGVIHRDLKPSNVMVGRFGEVYVMDWGLAKILGREDGSDLTARCEAGSTMVRTERTEDSGAGPDSPLVTQDGTVLGTPTYMSPEQAEGRTEDLGPHSDVYAMGAILYEMLTGEPPYSRPGTRLSPRTILALILRGPPRPVHEINPNVPSELIAICETAMAGELESRYADMIELGDDIRDFLEHPAARFTTRLRREAYGARRRRDKRVVALGLAAGFLAIGLAGSLVLHWRSAERQGRLEAREVLAEERRQAAEEEARIANEQRDLAVISERVAKARAPEARDRVNRWFQVLALRRFDELRRATDRLAPRTPPYQTDYEQRLEELAEIYRDAIDEAPDDSVNHYRLANVLWSSGDTPGAIESYRAAIRLSPPLAGLHVLLGDALFHDGDFEGAVAAYSRALLIEPDHARALAHLGDAQLQRRDIRSAIDTYRQVVQRRPEPSSFANLAMAQLRRGDVEGAADSLGSAIQRDPENGLVRHLLGVSLARAGDLDAAIEAQREAIRLDPRLAEAHCHLAYELMSAGRYEEARKTLAELHRSMVPTSTERASSKQ